MKHRSYAMVAIVLAVLVLPLLNAPAPWAAETEEDMSWQFHDIVGIDFVAQYVQVPMPEGVMLIDARPKQAKYDPGHIPGSVSIPDTYFDRYKDRLPADKSTLLIYYCEGLKCKLSHKSAKKAEALGYTNVKVFAEGFPAWVKTPGRYAAVSVDWVKKQVDAGADMVLIDSRPKRPKYEEGHIPGALSIPDTYFDKFQDQLPQDKGKTLVFYCGGYECKLSHKSAEKAMALGYTDVRVFAGGYPEWKAVAGDSGQAAGAAATAVKAGKEEGTIDHEAFKAILSGNPDSIYLYDVRDPEEFAKGTLPGAVNLPVDKLEAQIDGLPGDKPIVFICGTGARSGEAYYMIQDLRPSQKNVFYLDGELTIHEDGTFELKKPA